MKKSFRETQEIFINMYAENIAQEFGIPTTSISKSTANGYSLYIDYRGFKIRFSDHQTSTFSGRHLEEVQVGLTSTKDDVDTAIEMRNPANYVEQLEERIYVTSEKGIKHDQQRTGYDYERGALVRYNKKGVALYEWKFMKKVTVFVNPNH